MFVASTYIIWFKLYGFLLLLSILWPYLSVQCQPSVLDRLSYGQKKRTYIHLYIDHCACKRNKILKNITLDEHQFYIFICIHIHIRSILVFVCQTTWPMIMTIQKNNTSILKRSLLDEIDHDIYFNKQLEINILFEAKKTKWHSKCYRS